MKRMTLVWFLLVPAAFLSADERRFVTSDRLSLGTQSDRSAAVRVADVNGDGKPDLLVANGRHWPQQNYVFMNQGRARFTVQRHLGADLCTSYATEPGDLDGDGDLDLVVGNDMAPNQVLLNDGDGQFTVASQFGTISSVRSLTVTDIDRDGDLDVLTTCRGRSNQICLNDGTGRLVQSASFGTQRDSTIDVAVTDWNGDGHHDLVLANRDSQPNAILLNDGDLNFDRSISFGSRTEQTRAIAVADLNGDSHPDIITGNISQSNRVYLANGKGGFGETADFGRKDGRSYSIAVADLDGDEDIDIVVGNVGQENAVFFNKGDGTSFSEVRFGNPSHATYGVDTGDLNGDGFTDIAVANSDAKNFVYLNRVSPVQTLPKRATERRGGSTGERPSGAPLKDPNGSRPSAAVDDADWTTFRGNDGTGVADGFPIRTEWTADDPEEAEGVLWSVSVPGLVHSSPVIRDGRIYLATAIATEGKAALKVGRGGRPDAADDNGEQAWVVLCYQQKTGKELWRRTARKGKPRATRHVKATHANTSVAIEGDNVVAFFGSEGMYCYDLDGNQKWSRDLGVIDISKYGIGWGYASSPAVHQGRVVIVCDDPSNPFVAALSLADGKEIWRTSRTDICVRSWGTPFVHTSPTRTQAVINGWPWIVSYDLTTGEELWRIRGGGDNPVPTPFQANGWIYVTNAHGAESPIFVVRPDATGDISPTIETGSSECVVWSTRKGGSYMSTPVVYGDYLYLGNTNGVLRCFHARTGEKIYEERLGSGAAVTLLLSPPMARFCALRRTASYTS